MIKTLRHPGKRMARRGWPIHGYIGPNGGGKTCAAVWDTLPSLEAGRPVLSTVRLLDYLNPRLCDDPACDSPDHHKHMAAHPLWIRWDRWSQLLEVEHCDVIADEVTGVASSRESSSMPATVANTLVQLRRRDVVMRWTSPSWSRADLILRECSQAATLCTGFLPVDVEGEGDEVARMWRHRRLFRWLTYDSALVDDLTAAKLRGTETTTGMRPMTADFHWGPGSPAFSAYDTFDSVSSFGAVAVGGRCETCHGRRSAPSCSCPEYVERPRRGRAGTSGGGVPAPRGSTVDPDLSDLLPPSLPVPGEPARSGGSAVTLSTPDKAKRRQPLTADAASSPTTRNELEADAFAYGTPTH